MEKNQETITQNIPTLTEIHAIKTSGDLNKAKELLLLYTKQNPNDAEAFNLLGLTLADLGNHQEAIEMYQRAIELKPDNGTYINNLAVSYKALGMFEASKRALQRAVEIDENCAEALNNLANAYRDEGLYSEAIKLYEKALSLKPNVLEIKINLAIVLADVGDYKRAETLLREVLSVNPNHLIARRTLGFILGNMGKHEEAETELRLALLLNPKDSKTLAELGGLLVKCEPGYPKEAEELLKAAISIDPACSEAYHNLGVLYLTTGKKKEASLCFEKAYQIKPSIVLLKLIISTKEKFSEQDPEFLKLKELEKKEQTLPNKTELLYAFVDAYERLKEDDKFFEYLIQANTLKRSQITYDSSEIKEMVSSRIKIFDEETVKRNLGYAYPSAVPVFIVGMPRSGTTLMESILAEHPEVYGAGELKLMQRVLHDGIIINKILFTSRQEGLPEKALQEPLGFFELGRRYVTQLREMAPEARRITDKMPANAFNLGLICLSIAWARVILMRRHPLDNILSCFRQNFAEGHEFTYDLKELAMYYNEYFRMMKHWKKIFPGRILEVDYESLVFQPETEIRKVLNYCGLDWHEGCLKFYESKRQVKTASQEQVRKPFYTSSIGKWKKFEKYFKPVMETLSEEVKEEIKRVDALIDYYRKTKG